MIDYSIKTVAGDKSTVKEENIKTKSKNIVSITLVTPKIKTNKVFIIVPGFGVDKENSSKNLLIPRFIKRNIACLTFDLFGHGKSSGKMIDLTVTDIIEEVDAVTKYLHSNGFKNIAIYASSLPALGVSLALAKYKSEAKLYLLQSPLFNIDDYIDDPGRANWQKRGYILHNSSTGNVKFGYKYYLDAVKYKDKNDYLINIQARTLVLLGAKDEYLPIPKIEREVKKINNLSETVIFPNSGHIMSEEKEKLYEAIFKFTTKYL